eukprot:TRINITY_DN79942_c0_g1_i1.p1 TRINITY_DN79942_c0_g1~~TRINITY_DN79942_c0_g1_i1.p1  ORF type:complete len:317 (-),score=26.27 TRINITY_DN79942_c0_g1_i1:142-1038(-)
MGIKTKKPWQGFACSAFGSCVADFVCTPLDVVKVRMQLSRSGVVGEIYSGPIDVVRTMLRNEGPRGLYKGLSPAILRACTYGSARIAFYEPIKQVIAGDTPSDKLPLHSKCLAGVGSGGLASFIFSPVDLLKVRMQGDKAGLRYTRLFPSFVSIAHEEGLSGMYRGSSATVGRAAVCGMVELATYDEFKSLFIAAESWPYGDSLPTHFAASLAAGFLSTLLSAPVDLVKSRMMNQPSDASGRPTLYTSPVQCFRKTVAAEGFRGLYAGFWPNYLRLGPHTVLVFVSVEQARHRMGWAE